MPTLTNAQTLLAYNDLAAHLAAVDTEQRKFLEAHAALDESGVTRTADDPEVFGKAGLPETLAAQAAYQRDLIALSRRTWECPETLSLEDLAGFDVSPEVLAALGPLLAEGRGPGSA